MDSDPLAAAGLKSGLEAVPQAVAQPLTRAAIFLVATMSPGVASRGLVRSLCGDLSALVRAVGFRDLGRILEYVPPEGDRR